MILEFDKYIAPGSLPSDPVLIYPGLQLHVRLDRYSVSIIGLPSRSGRDVINVNCATPEKAQELFRDIDMFLQYRTLDLPEYKL